MGSPSVWMLIFASILRLSEVFAAHTAATCSSVCADTLNTLTSHLTAQASKLSSECNSAADNKRTVLLAGGLSELESAVRSSLEPLTKCGLNSDDLSYFRCLQDVMDEVKESLEAIDRKSTKLVADHAAELSEIDKEETHCLDAIVHKSKLETDQAFAEYRECLTTVPDCGSLTTSTSSTSMPSSTASTSATSLEPSSSSSTSMPSPISSTSSSSSSSSSSSTSSTVSPTASLLSSPPSSSTSPWSSPSASSTSSSLSQPDTSSPSTTSPTTTLQPETEETSKLAPEWETSIQHSSAGGSNTFVAVTAAAVVLVITLLVATYWYITKARRRKRWELRNRSSHIHNG